MATGSDLRAAGLDGARGRRAAAWLAAVLVLALSLMPLQGLPPAPDHGDKLVHGTFYAILATLFTRAYPHCPPLPLAVLLSAYGGAIELAQQQLPPRTASLADAVANAVGASIMLAVLRRRRAARASPPQRDDSQPP